MMTLIRRFVKDEGGATAIEYALIAGMIFLAIIGAVTLFANRAGQMFDRVSAAVSAVVG